MAGRRQKHRVRWRKLDPTDENFPIYNRYAHISIVLDKGATRFNMDCGDMFELTLNPADLPKLDARYILSRNGELEKLSTAAVKFTKLYEDAGIDKGATRFNMERGDMFELTLNPADLHQT